MTLSVDNKRSNISAALHPIGAKKIASISAKNYVSKDKISRQGQVGPGPKKICQSISAI